MKQLKTKRFLISLRSLPDYVSQAGIRNDNMVCYWGGGKQRSALRSAAFLLPYLTKIVMSFRTLPAATAVKAGR